MKENPGGLIVHRGKLHGRLRVTRISADGQQSIVRIVNPGDLFGIAQALKRTDYPGTATAVMEEERLVRWGRASPMAAGAMVDRTARCSCRCSTAVPGVCPPSAGHCPPKASGGW